MSTEETPEMLAALAMHGTAETPDAKPKRKTSKAAAAKAAKAADDAKTAADTKAAAEAAGSGDQTMVGNPGVVDPPPPGTEAPAAPTGDEPPVTEWAGSPGSAKRTG